MTAGPLRPRPLPRPPAGGQPGPPVKLGTRPPATIISTRRGWRLFPTLPRRLISTAATTDMTVPAARRPRRGQQTIGEKETKRGAAWLLLAAAVSAVWGPEVFLSPARRGEAGPAGRIVAVSCAPAPRSEAELATSKYYFQLQSVSRFLLEFCENFQNTVNATTLNPTSRNTWSMTILKLK